jgi:hypothetical protein
MDIGIRQPRISRTPGCTIICGQEDTSAPSAGKNLTIRADRE